MDFQFWVSNGISLSLFVGAIWFIFSLSRSISLLEQSKKNSEEKILDLKQQVKEIKGQIREDKDTFNDKIDKGLDKIYTHVDNKMREVKDELSQGVQSLNKLILEKLLK